jgi:hypothetical protein
MKSVLSLSILFVEAAAGLVLKVLCLLVINKDLLAWAFAGLSCLKSTT